MKFFTNKFSKPTERVLVRSRVKTECTIQFEGSECGAASFSTILRYFRKYVPLSELRLTTGVSRDGANAKLLMKAAEHYKMKHKVYKANKFVLNEITRYPCIVFWGFNHFVVLEGFEDNHAYIADPANGRYRVSLDYFWQKFTGYVLEFEPDVGFQPSGKFVPNLDSVFKFIRLYPVEIALIFAVNILTLVPLLLIAGIITVYTNEILSVGKLDLAIPSVWLLVTASFLYLILQYIALLIQRRLEYKMVRLTGYHLFKQLLLVPLTFLDTRFTSELSQRAMFCFEISNMVVQNIINYSARVIMALLILVFIFFMSPPLFIVFTVILSVNYFFTRRLTKNRLDVNVSYSIVTALSRSITLQGINNISIIKACGEEFDFIEGWLSAYTQQVNQTQILGQQIAKSQVLSKASSLLMSISIFTLGGLLVLVTSSLSVGSLISLLFLIGIVTAPLLRLPSLTQTLQLLDGYLGRYEDLMNNTDDDYVRSFSTLEHDDSKSQSVDPNELSRSLSVPSTIKFNNVDLQFNPLLGYILKDISFDISSKSKIAFCGPSGSGKSTILKIIAGLIHQSNGQYLINDKTWVQNEEHFLRSFFAYVPQYSHIFNGTMRENLTLYNDDVYSDEDILKAAEVTTLLPLIQSNPGGLDTHLDDGGNNISGGQRQLFQLTRALLRNPQFLILDEATASLDPATETKVLNNLWDMDIGIISAAHRLASAVKSDVVFVLKDGSIIEHDTPENLLKDTTSFFYQLHSLES